MRTRSIRRDVKLPPPRMSFISSKANRSGLRRSTPNCPSTTVACGSGRRIRNTPGSFFPEARGSCRFSRAIAAASIGAQPAKASSSRAIIACFRKSPTTASHRLFGP